MGRRNSPRRVENNKELQTVLRAGMPSRIKALRNARGMSQDKLAEECGVTRGAVAQWESGLVRNIRLLTFMRLCEALGTDPLYLIYGPDRSPPKETLEVSKPP